MDGAPVIRLETPTTAASQRLRDALHRDGIRTYEADIKPSVQHLMDLRVHGAAAVEGEWRKGRRVDRIYENPSLGPADDGARGSPCFPLTSRPTRAPAPCTRSLLSCGTPARKRHVEEVLLNGSGAAAARCYPSEESMLAALRARIVELDPDIITGWNVVDFDFRVLARRFAAIGVPFDIGRSDSPASFLDRDDTDGITRWRRSKAIVPGRQVLDAMWLVRMAGMGLEDYRLETVAQSVLGRGKRIDELPGRKQDRRGRAAVPR